MQKKCQKNSGRTVRRGLVGAAGAVPLAILAAGAGAAMGPEKGVALVGSAAVAGASFTNYYGDKVAKEAGSIYRSGKEVFWGKDNKKVQQYKYDQKFLKDPKTIDELTKTLGSRSKAKAAIKDGTVQAFLNNNITDVKHIGKALKLQQNYKENMKKEYEKKKIKVGAKEEREIADMSLQKSIAMAMWHRDINMGIFEENSTEQIAWKNGMYSKLRESGETKKDATKHVDEFLADLASFEQ